MLELIVVKKLVGVFALGSWLYLRRLNWQEKVLGVKGELMRDRLKAWKLKWGAQGLKAGGALIEADWEVVRKERQICARRRMWMGGVVFLSWVSLGVLFLI